MLNESMSHRQTMVKCYLWINELQSYGLMGYSQTMVKCYLWINELQSGDGHMLPMD